MQQSLEADLAADDLLDDLAGGGGRVIGIDGAEDDMRRHRHRQVGELAERREIVALQLAERGVDGRQLEMRVGEGAAVAGDMLHDRQHAARHQAFGGGAAHRGDDIRLLAVGALADDVAGAFDRHVEHGQAVGGDAVALEIEGVQAREQPDGALAGLVILLPERAERGAGRIIGRERRADALHAAAFLVDEDRRVGAADAIAHLGDEIADLLGLADVAGKQDEAPGGIRRGRIGLPRG